MSLIPKSITPVSASIAAALVGIVWFACCDGESQVEFDTTSLEQEIWTYSSRSVAHERSVRGDISYRAYPIVNSRNNPSGNFPVLERDCAIKYSAPSGDGWLENSEHPCDESDEHIRRAEFHLHGERYPGSTGEPVDALLGEVLSADTGMFGGEAAVEAVDAGESAEKALDEQSEVAALPELPVQTPQSELERDARIDFLRDVNQSDFANGVRNKLAAYAIWDLDDDFLGCIRSETSRSVNYAQERTRLRCERSEQTDIDLDSFTAGLSDVLANTEAQVAAFSEPHPEASQQLSGNRDRWPALYCAPTQSSPPVHSGGNVSVRISSNIRTVVPVSLLAGERITADLGSGRGDSYLELWDSHCRGLLTSNDDSGPGSDSRLTWTASSSGTYLFITKAYGSNSTVYDATLTVSSNMPDVTPEQIAGYNTYITDVTALITQLNDGQGEARTMGQNTVSYNNSRDQNACLDASMMADHDYAMVRLNAFSSATQTCGNWIDSLVNIEEAKLSSD